VELTGAQWDTGLHKYSQSLVPPSPLPSSVEANTGIIHNQRQKAVEVASVLLLRHILNTKSWLECCFSLLNSRMWQCKMGLTNLHNSYDSWHLYICRSLFVYLTIFAALLVFMKGILCSVIKEEFQVKLSRKIMLWQIFVSHRSAWFPLLSACRLLDFDTSAICHVFMYNVLWCAFKSPRICFRGTKHDK